MTNTNYHIAFDRMFARGATTEIDAAYSNPAGLVWGHEGIELSLNLQKPWQRRNIETQMDNFLGQPYDKEYVGKASALHRTGRPRSLVQTALMQKAISSSVS